jgi:hypothetical protein
MPEIVCPTSLIGALLGGTGYNRRVIPAPTAKVDSTRIGREELMQDPQPGLYVETHFVARVPALGPRLKPGAGEWLRRTPPVAIVGHSLYVYDIGAKTSRLNNR